MDTLKAGCGACVITAEVPDPSSGKLIVKSINSVNIYFFMNFKFIIFSVINCVKNSA